MLRGLVRDLDRVRARVEVRHALAALVDPCIHRYLYPEPRLRLGTLLGRNRAATACMDVSDGLADAVHQLADASRVGATIDGGALPIDPGARNWFEQQGHDAVNASVTGGDDYELLIAARPRLRGRLAAAERHGDAPLTRIGSCTADRAVLNAAPTSTTRSSPATSSCITSTASPAMRG